MHGSRRGRVVLATLTVALVAGGCSGDDGGAADIGSEVEGEVRGVLGPDDDGGGALQVAIGDGTIVEVIVASEDALRCADGTPLTYPEVTGLPITATVVPGSQDEDASGRVVRSDEVVVDC